jgi:hypothetical protein
MGQFFFNSSAYAEWTVVSAPCISSDWGLFSIRFPWAAGQDSQNKKGVLLYFPNGSWITATLPEVSSDWALSGLDLTSSNKGWAVGQDFENRRGVLIYFRNPEIPELATVTTAAVSNITDTTATGGGNVTSDGGTAVTARGVCWNTSGNPVVEGEDTCTTDGTGTGVFTSSITGLTLGTLYHVRAYATNSTGTAYGSDLTFTTTVSPLPTVTTTPVSNITATTAIGGGNVTSDGGTPIIARGVCWDLSVNPTVEDSTCTDDGTGTGVYTSSITGLTPDTLYHVRAYAVNSVDAAYGSDLTFSTTASTLAIVVTAAPSNITAAKTTRGGNVTGQLKLSLASVTTTAPSNVTETTAIGGGDVTSDGGTPVTARGVCWSTSQNPVVGGTCTNDGTGTGVFTSSITGLTPSTLYHVRAYATNSDGTAYGSDLTFSTPPLPTLTTTPISNITSATATGGGNITSDGGTAVTARGVCWDTSANPVVGGACTNDGTGTGVFTSSITGLTLCTFYYVRAYATNSNGTAYGDELTFLTTSTAGNNLIWPSLKVVPPNVSSDWGLSAVDFLSSDNGWAVGQDFENGKGVILLYSDGVWISIRPPNVSSNWGLSSVHFPWAVGQDSENGNGVILHFSGGSWKSIMPPDVSSSWGLLGVRFISSHEAWTVGEDFENKTGVILHFSDGSWTPVTPPDVSSDWGLSAIDFISSHEAWAVGEDFENGKGVLLHYLDGSWTSVSPPDVSSDWGLSGVDLISANSGWAVGQTSDGYLNGVLLRYTVPKISVSPTSIDYGDVEIGAFLERTVTVKNIGNGTLVIGTVTTSPSPPFSISADSCSGRSFARFQACKITYRFLPDSPGKISGNSFIPSNDSDQNPVTVTLNGNGVGNQNYINLLSPSDGQTFTACDYSNPPPFRWDFSGTFTSIEVQFSLKNDFSKIALQIRGDLNSNQLIIRSNVWRRILLLPGTNEPLYWRVIAKKKDKTMVESNVFSLVVDPPEPVWNLDISDTSKTAPLPPAISWNNTCNITYTIWFGKDSDFKNPYMKKMPIYFKDSDGIQGTVTKELTPAQWNSIRKLGGNITGATVYWYVQSVDTLGRRQSSDVTSFVLTD